MIRTQLLGISMLLLSVSVAWPTHAQSEHQFTPEEKERLERYIIEFKRNLNRDGGWQWLGVSTCTMIDQNELTPREGVNRMLFAAMIEPPTEQERNTLTLSIRKTCTLETYSTMYSILQERLSDPDPQPQNSSPMNQI